MRAHAAKTMARALALFDTGFAPRGCGPEESDLARARELVALLAQAEQGLAMVLEILGAARGSDGRLKSLAHLSELQSAKAALQCARSQKSEALLRLDALPRHSA